MSRFNLLSTFLDLLFPPRCVFCRDILKHDKNGLCAACQNKLPWIVGPAAEQKLEFISLCISPLWYQGEVRESVHRFKFSNCSGYANFYGRLIAQCVEDHLDNRYDLITWVPLSAKRKKMRGYDQAMLLAQSTAQELKSTAIETLQKVRNTNTQSSLKDDFARRANVMGAYEISDPDAIKGKRILLIDDVVTTGSTMSECARVLLTYGATDVVCATLARARGAREN